MPRKSYRKADVRRVAAMLTTAGDMLHQALELQQRARQLHQTANKLGQTAELLACTQGIPLSEVVAEQVAERDRQDWLAERRERKAERRQEIKQAIADQKWAELQAQREQDQAQEMAALLAQFDYSRELPINLADYMAEPEPPPVIVPPPMQYTLAPR